MATQKGSNVAGQLLPQSFAQNLETELRDSHWVEGRGNWLMAELSMWFSDKQPRLNLVDWNENAIFEVLGKSRNSPQSPTIVDSPLEISGQKQKKYVYNIIKIEGKFHTDLILQKVKNTIYKVYLYFKNSKQNKMFKFLRFLTGWVQNWIFASWKWIRIYKFLLQHLYLHRYVFCSVILIIGVLGKARVRDLSKFLKEKSKREVRSLFNL